jgi:hypothetical protein
VNNKDTIFANRRVFFANAVVILSSFQYGVDFGLIGGLQAMPGFLSVLSPTEQEEVRGG